MGIFDGIKKVFNNAVSWVKNTWNLNKKFFPYFIKREQFTILKKIDEIIDNDITKIYQETKSFNSKKHAKAILRYESFLPKVREHNRIVDLINNGMKGFEFRSFIDAPLSHDINELNSYVLIVNKIKTFASFDEEYSTFCNEVLEINNNYEFIKQQFLLLDLYNKVFDFTEDYYLDVLEKNKLIDKLEPLLSCLRETGKRYYDFSNLDKMDYSQKGYLKGDKIDKKCPFFKGFRSIGLL